MSGLRALLGTIRVRLTLWYVALLAVMLAAFSAFLCANLSRRLHADADRSLALDAQRVIATLDVKEGRPALGEGSDSLGAGTVVAIYDAAGRHLLARSDAPLTPSPSPQALLDAAEGHRTLATARAPDGSVWRVLTTPAVEGHRQVAILQLARSQRDIEAVLGQLVLLVGIAVPATLVLAIVGGVFLAGRALDPVERIIRTAERIGAEDLSRRLHFGGSDELSRFAGTFDRMLDRLQAAFQRQRQFTADASHELRTPLAMIGSQIDLALERPRDAEEYRAVLTSLREDTTRLTQLTNELLSLARADAGQHALDLEPLDLATVVEDVVTTMRPLAQNAGVELAHRTETGLLVSGDQTRLTQVLVNLIDNGIRYAPAGGSVTVIAWREAKRIIVTVSDTGIIEAEHLPHLFERFYRADAARARSAGGAGLGLAICKWIVEAHGGDIGVASVPGIGTIVTVHLPPVS